MENQTNRNPSISVVIPAYNEERGISKVLEDIKSTLDNTGNQYEIIVVDDGSSDKTAKIVQEKNFVRLIQHPFNRGYGAALKTGIKEANWDLILITDGDGTYPSKYILELLEYADKYDMVVGARTGKDVSIPLFRRPGKLLLTKLANYLVNAKIPDLNSGMRLFKKEDLIKYFNILPPGFSFTITITLSYLSDNLTVKYVPIDYHERHGYSKIKPFRDGMNFIFLILRVVTYFNPLKIFIPVSVSFFLIGSIILIYQLVSNQNVGDLPVLLLVSSFQIGFIGMLADLIVKRK